MNLSASTLGCPDWDLPTLIARLREYGFNGFDLRGLQRSMKPWQTPEFSTRLRDTAARLRDSGLALSCISSSINLAHAASDKMAENDEDLARITEICAALGCRQIRVFGGDLSLFAGNATESERARVTDHMVARIRSLAGRAQSLAPVDLLIETHDAWTNSEHLLRVLEGANHPRVGCCWDIKHTWWLAKEVAETTWSRLRPWVRNTHWKDVRRHRGSNEGYQQDLRLHGMLVPMGDGLLPARDAYDLLAADNYDGWFTLEWEKQWHPHIAEPDVAFPAFVRFMHGLEAGWHP